MELLLKRHTFKPTYTIGKLFLNSKYFCDVIEDTVRDLNMDGDLDDCGEGKVYGKTAIPYGRYEVQVTMSTRFKKLLPILIGVKGFEGIRIHSGNTEQDSLGCLIVGENKEVGKVLNSRVTMDKLMKEFESHKMEKHYITIEKS